MYHFSSAQKCLSCHRNTEDYCCDSTWKEHFSQHITPSPWLILLFVSATTADNIALLQMRCLYCIYTVGPIVSISLSEQKTFVVHSSNLFYWHGTISIVVPLGETGARVPQGKREEEQPTDTGCLLCRHHRQIIVIRFMCALRWVMLCMGRQSTARLYCTF